MDLVILGIKVKRARFAFKQWLQRQRYERQTCPARMGQAGPWKREPDLDVWIPRRGGRTCSFCGSLHPEDILPIFKRAAVDPTCNVDPSTKGNKFYIHRKEIANAQHGGIKFYTYHLQGISEELHNELNEAYKPAVKASMDRTMALAEEIRQGRLG